MLAICQVANLALDFAITESLWSILQWKGIAPLHASLETAVLHGGLIDALLVHQRFR